MRVPRSSCLVMVVALGTGWSPRADALEWQSPLGVSLHLDGQWEVVPQESLRASAAFGARHPSDGTVVVVAVFPNEHGVTVSDLRAGARSGKIPGGMSQVEVEDATHQGLPALDVRALVDRADGRWRVLMRQVPTRKHVYLITVTQPAAAAPAGSAKTLLEALRLEGGLAIPPRREETLRERAVSHLLGEGLLVLMAVGVAGEWIRRRRRARAQAPRD